MVSYLCIVFLVYNNNLHIISKFFRTLVFNLNGISIVLTIRNYGIGSLYKSFYT